MYVIYALRKGVSFGPLYAVIFSVVSFFLSQKKTLNFIFSYVTKELSMVPSRLRTAQEM
jgi:hypothetical protein